MDKRALKRELKAFMIRQFWLKAEPESWERFELMYNIRTEKQKERMRDVVFQIYKEWN